MRRGDRGVGATAKQTGVQIEPDEKHIQNDTELGDHAEKRPDLGWKDAGRKLRVDASQQRRPEDYSPQNLADDGWLSERAKEPSQQPAGEDDCGERQQDMQERVRSQSRRRRGSGME